MRHGFIKVAAATPSIKVADCDYNTQQIINLINKAEQSEVHLLVLPELCVTGYTCSDLFFQQALIESARESIITISSNVPKNMVVVFGAPFELRGKLHNCAIVASSGKILGIVPKKNLPNYQEFYERRWFTPALPNEETVEIGEQNVFMSSKLIFTCNSLPYFRLACEICEDLWVPNPPSVNHAINGATIIANLSASNECTGKSNYRDILVENQSARLKCGYIYANAGEGESSTDLVYTGYNMICDCGNCIAKHQMKEDQLLVTELDVQKIEHERRIQNTFVTTNDKEYRYIPFNIELGDTSLTRVVSKHPFITGDSKQLCEETLALQALGLKRRIIASNSETAILGVSGGLDSTLALLVTVKAFTMLDKDLKDIICVTMPCFGTSDRTHNNAEKLVQELGCTLLTIDIKTSVLQHFRDIGQSEDNWDSTYENAQARERTQVLMDLANKYGGIVIGTGDLSELTLGWSTYNGDHMSMYGVNSGVPKTLVRHLVEYVAGKTENTNLRQVLTSVLETPISPELIPGNQATEDFVGPYELHDFFIYYALKYGYTPSKIYRLAKNAFSLVYDDYTIQKWLKVFYKRLFSQQFKRSCMPDGPKVGPVSLSPRGDWKMPSDACVSEWQRELENALIND